MSITEALVQTTMPVLDPIAQKFLDDLAAPGGKPIYELSVEDARGVLSNAQAGPVNKLPADIEDMTIVAGPTGRVGIRIVRPKGNAQDLPVVMYFHGGGWVLGGQDTHDRLLREIANGVQAAVVFVDYTRSPEAQYPIAIEEAYAATKWISEHGEDLRMDPSRLAVAGDSVGGNMVAAVTMLAKERGGPQIKFQAMFYPVTDANFDTSSYLEFANGYFLEREGMKWFWNQYAPDEASRDKSTASPLRASIEELTDLPPALVVVGECDVLRDEGEAYARKLMRAGVNVTSMRFPGITHDFAMLNALAQAPATRAAIGIANALLRQALMG